ncbi:hypothetical protein Pla110_43690 [Polystyrenella longa]|uniref:Uncharacterized protein n=1 Tax=Polystyrenella longa TaxID=2528007 RepID=A0A518CTS8_9PLAN|nr:hypothetical protein Pla110_43690 [Polystyrenella longa]
MAYGKRIECDHCGFKIEAWDEGDPYIRGFDGKKEYVYHPDPRRYEATGLDVPHLCMDCGCKYKVDEGKPKTCRRCKSSRRKKCFELEGETCPKCKQGKFIQDPKRYMIS